MKESGLTFAHLELVRKIASGGMGEVWEARHLGPHQFRKRLAVKKILPHLVEDSDFVHMFLDEGRLVAQLEHPNICQIFRMGEAKNTYYMEMEFVDGVVLTELIDKASRRGMSLPLSHCCQIAIGICAGLDYAHTRTDEAGRPLGIIHRDISPPNVMLSQEGYVKILDFGIAKARSRLQSTLPGLLKGKMGYVSPEQVDGVEIDARSDVFSVGIVLWEMLTSRRLFYGHDELSVLKMIGSGQYTSPGRYCKDLPAEFEWIVMKALALQPSDRFQSCGDMQQELEDFLFRSGIPVSNRRLSRFVSRLMADLPVAQEPLPQRGRSGYEVDETSLSHELAGVEPQADPVTLDYVEDDESEVNVVKQRILVTDDEQDILDAVRLILSSSGFHVETARDGLEAVEWVRKAPFDVCMLDLDMPRLDGRGALEQISMIQPSLPCIIQTGNDSFHTAAEMGRRGAVTYLLKPARRKAVLQAVRDALSHRPEGQAFESIWMNEFPTPLAELRGRYRELPQRDSAVKSRHAMLAALFDMVTGWLGVVALSTYRRDGCFAPALNQRIVQLTRVLHSGVWLTLFAEILDAYREHKRDFHFRAFGGLFSHETWKDPFAQANAEALLSHFSPLLHQPVASSGEAAWDAMRVLSQYHTETWRHDALLPEQDIALRVSLIEAFLLRVLERCYRMIDFQMVRVDGQNIDVDGVQHDLTVFRGKQTETQSFVSDTRLEAGAMYLFDLSGHPVLKLSPLLIAYPCTTAGCDRNSLALPVQFGVGQDLFYRCLSCGLLRRPGVLVQREVEQFMKAFQ